MGTVIRFFEFFAKLTDISLTFWRVEMSIF